MRKIDREAEKALQDQYNKDVSRWKTITFYVTCSSFVVAMAVLILVGFGWGAAIIPSILVSSIVMLASLIVVEVKKRSRSRERN